jgi:hypothetical protein
MVKEKAYFVTQGEAGAGVTELADEMIASDLAEREALLAHHHLLLAKREDDTELRIAPVRANLLLAGPSGGGKSTIVGGILERLAESHYQFCVIDPEGDYENLQGAVDGRAATPVEGLRLLNKPQEAQPSIWSACLWTGRRFARRCRLRWSWAAQTHLLSSTRRIMYCRIWRRLASAAEGAEVARHALEPGAAGSRLVDGAGGGEMPGQSMGILLRRQRAAPPTGADRRAAKVWDIATGDFGSRLPSWTSAPADLRISMPRKLRR